MARCEDFPCCGHQDADGSSFCPDTSGRMPCANCTRKLPKNSSSSLCKVCHRRLDKEEREDY